MTALDYGIKLYPAFCKHRASKITILSNVDTGGSLIGIGIGTIVIGKRPFEGDVISTRFYASVSMRRFTLPYLARL